MKPSALQVRPFDQGAASVKTGPKAKNPFDKGSVEFKNFELGRTYALESKDSAARFQLKRP